MKTGLYGALLALASATAQENYSTWSLHRSYTLNNSADTSQGGTGLTETVANFPLLVRLTPADSSVFAQAANNGADVRFTDPTGTVRWKHHREDWNAAARTAEFWVLLPVVAGNAQNAFRMYWGKPGAPDSSNGRTVFDTANGFAAVWHMNGTDDEADATANGLVATHAAAPASGNGAVGRARLFNGTSQYFSLQNSASGPLNFRMTDSYSFSAWVHLAGVPNTANSGLVILNKGDNQWMFELYDAGATPKYWVMETRGNNTFLNARSNTAMPPITANEGVGSWHYIAGTYRGGAVGTAIAETLYYDGKRAAVMAATNTNNNGRNESFNVHMGAMPNNASAPAGSSRSRFWNGSLDEVRACRTSRSAAWIKLSYETQKPGSRALSAGPAQPTALSRPRAAHAEPGRAATKEAEFRSLNGRFVPGQDAPAPGVYVQPAR
jgi:biopolymer transport protein ExbB